MKIDECIAFELMGNLIMPTWVEEAKEETSITYRLFRTADGELVCMSYAKNSGREFINVNGYKFGSLTDYSGTPGCCSYVIVDGALVECYKQNYLVGIPVSQSTLDKFNLRAISRLGEHQAHMFKPIVTLIETRFKQGYSLQDPCFMGHCSLVAVNNGHGSVIKADISYIGGESLNLSFHNDDTEINFREIKSLYRADNFCEFVANNMFT